MSDEDHMFLAIVPAYNESRRIGSVVRSLFDHVDKVVVVDDYSKDTTADVANNAGAIVLKHTINLGQGASLETGHAYARRMNADYVLHFDGDGQFDVSDIEPALEKLKKEKLDVVLGSRFLGDRKNISIPWTKRYIISPLGRIVDWFFSGLKLSDAHNGFRLLNRHALGKIKITQNRMAHASEIIYLIKKYDLKFIEFPVKVTYHEYGQRASSGFCIVRDLLLGRFLK